MATATRGQRVFASGTPEPPRAICRGSSFRRGAMAHRAGRARASSGFSLIEVVIVVILIGIIAAIAIPRLSRGSAAAADSAVAQNLQTLRGALDAFQAEHNGVFPAANASPTVADLLLKYSDADAATVSPTADPTHGVIYGPYLRPSRLCLLATPP